MTNPRRAWLGVAVLLAVAALGWAALAYGRLSGANGAEIVISGSVSKRFITGSLWDRTRNKLTHRLCNGRTRFRIRLH
jgi:hypothetical protein